VTLDLKRALAADFDRIFARADTTRVAEIHTHACAQCPSVHCPDDPETLDYMAASKAEQLDSVFRCAWRTKKRAEATAIGSA
jgi:hypothetical protein